MVSYIPNTTAPWPTVPLNPTHGYTCQAFTITIQSLPDTGLCGCAEKPSSLSLAADVFQNKMKRGGIWVPSLLSFSLDSSLTYAFELWCWSRLLRIPWTARRPNQSILKEIIPEYSLEELLLKLKLQYFGHLM